MRAPFAALESRLAVVDPDRLAAARFAAPPGRERLAAIYALNDEAARVAEVVSEPMIGEIRLAWWREAIAELARDPASARRHPVVEAFQAAFTPEALQRLAPDLEALVDGRRGELYRDPAADASSVRAYVDATAGAVMAAAAAALMTPSSLEPWRAGLAAAGRAWGYARLALTFESLAAQGRAPIAASDPTTAVGDLAACARRDFEHARRDLRGAPSGLWPAIGYVRLLRRDLTAMAVRMPPPRRPDFARHFELVLSSLTGAL